MAQSPANVAALTSQSLSALNQGLLGQSDSASLSESQNQDGNNSTALNSGILGGINSLSLKTNNSALDQQLRGLTDLKIDSLIDQKVDLVATKLTNAVASTPKPATT